MDFFPNFFIACSRVICTKTKSKRLVDEEITTNVFVWNTNEYKQDENDNRISSELDRPDPCMRAQDEITLREIDEHFTGYDGQEHNVRGDFTNWSVKVKMIFCFLQTGVQSNQ